MVNLEAELLFAVYRECDATGGWEDVRQFGLRMVVGSREGASATTMQLPGMGGYGCGGANGDFVWVVPPPPLFLLFFFLLSLFGF